MSSVDSLTEQQKNNGGTSKKEPEFVFEEEHYHAVEVQDVQRTGHNNNFRVTIGIPATKKVLTMRVGANEGTCLLHAIRRVEASRCCVLLQLATSCLLRLLSLLEDCVIIKCRTGNY